jgi:hypothetical protein
MNSMVSLVWYSNVLHELLRTFFCFFSPGVYSIFCQECICLCVCFTQSIALLRIICIKPSLQLYCSTRLACFFPQVRIFWLAVAVSCTALHVRLFVLLCMHSLSLGAQSTITTMNNQVPTSRSVTSDGHWRFSFVTPPFASLLATIVRICVWNKLFSPKLCCIRWRTQLPQRMIACIWI